jgi:hypothetical protein
MPYLDPNPRSFSFLSYFSPLTTRFVSWFDLNDESTTLLLIASAMAIIFFALLTQLIVQ